MGRVDGVPNLGGGDPENPLPVRTRHRQGWKGREIVAAAFFVLWLTVQLGVPLWKLTEQRQARFGWQMYSRYQPGVAYFAEDGDGTRRQIRLREFVGPTRPEIEYRRIIPPHMCKSRPGIATIVSERAGTAPQRFQCP